MRILLILTIFAISFTAAAAQSANSKAEGEIRKVMQEQSDAWNRGDIEGFMR